MLDGIVSSVMPVVGTPPVPVPQEDANEITEVAEVETLVASPESTEAALMEGGAVQASHSMMDFLA